MTDSERDGFETAVLRRMDQIVLLLVRATSDRDAISPTEAIVSLSQLGFSPPEIAKATGKSGDYVHSILRRKHESAGKKRPANRKR